MKALLSVIAILVAIIAWVRFGPMPANDRSDRPVSGLPWQIEALPDGTTRVSGLQLGVSTLDDASNRFGNDGEVALVAAPGETGSLEVYFPDVTLGAVTGKMVVTGEVSNDRLEAMRQRATKSEYMKSNTRKARLNQQDLPAAYAAPIRALAFIPSADLDEQMIVQRFGQPSERVRASEDTEHFLYPERGVDIILDAHGKELIQYVAPRDFARLREPLRQPVNNSASR
jgi:hypothetical protein